MRRFVGRLLVLGAGAVALYFLLCGLALAAFIFVDPPLTAVHVQRRIESWLEDEPYVKSYRPVSRAAISDHLEHAVVAAEDGRFFQHGGIDWEALEEALDDHARGRPRGASTITQQLVKNLFLTTHRSWVRKGAEVPLTYMAEAILSKQRILELYLNVVEWDRGVYGAEAAARHHYGVPASRLSRQQAASLAAVLPDPRRRSPERMVRYRGLILGRMRQMGW